MSGPPRLPPALRRALAEDARPVRPLAPPARRALVLLVWAPLAVAAVLAVGFRPDAASLGWLFSWGVVFAELAAGAGLVTLALAQAVPGRGAGRGPGLAALAGGTALFVALAILTHRASPGLAGEGLHVTSGVACLGMQGLVGVTALAVAAALILRAVPLRAALAGTLAGTGTGLMAEGVWHLHCPVTHLAHVLPWHGSAILFLGLLGLWLGAAVERRESGRMEARLAPPRKEASE